MLASTMTMLPKLETIVVGTDFSPHSDVAFAQALAIALQHGGRLVVVHAFAGNGVPDDAPAWERRSLMEARTRLAVLVQQAVDGGVRASSSIVNARPDEALVATGRREDADLIAVGTHGRTGYERWMLGSVAEHTVRSADRTTLVARSTTPAAGQHRRLLVGTDFSGPSEAALSFALRMAAAGAEIELLHCYQDPPGLEEHAPASVRQQRFERAIEQGNHLMAHLGGRCPGLRFNITREPPAVGLERRLETGPFDCLIIGGHGRHGKPRGRLGSVAEQTVRYASRSVFVVHSDHD